eukprot:Rmarinus@m.14178
MLETGFTSTRRRNYPLTEHRRDGLIEYIKKMCNHSFVLNCMEGTIPHTMSHIAAEIEAHRLSTSDAPSRLKTLVPSIGMFFTELPLRQAWDEYDAKYCVTRRRFVPPSFNEIRHILNLAQVHALKSRLKFVTFDGDQTLYQDGSFFQDEKLIRYVTLLLMKGINVALVTAAGYPHDPTKYEARLVGLLKFFIEANVPSEVRQRFFVLGGECNYLFRCNSEGRLVEIPLQEWQARSVGDRQSPINWNADQCKTLLDVAEESLRKSLKVLKLRAKVIRKERAVGIVPGGKQAKIEIPVGSGGKSIRRELLDECVFAVQDALKERSDINIPYCAFNGGSDVFVDVGNKRVGVQGIMRYLDFLPVESLHIGDQFLNTGNDYAARDACPTVWITSPRETKFVLKTILTDIGGKEYAKTQLRVGPNIHGNGRTTPRATCETPRSMHDDSGDEGEGGVSLAHRLEQEFASSTQRKLELDEESSIESEKLNLPKSKRKREHTSNSSEKMPAPPKKRPN